MRTLILALGFAALATGPALAQTGISRGSAPATATSTGTTTGTTTNTTTIPATTPIPAPPSGSAPASPGNSIGGSGAAGNVTTDTHADTPGSSFAPDGPFSNDSGNTALGTSAGQTSAGTLVGNSGTGVGANSAGLATGLPVVGVPELVPEGNVSIIGGTAGAPATGRPPVVAQSAPAQPPSATPLFDMAARQGRERIESRRAAGDEPRIYGIAPNTERDLTWQMPDDRIIRY